MKNTYRIARKEHPCDYCVSAIAPGERYLETKERGAVYDWIDEQEAHIKQVGIEYRTTRQHARHLEGVFNA